MLKKFLNVFDDVVSEMFDGVCFVMFLIVCIVDQNVFVYVREGEDKVVVILGGGSGYELVMVGYFG